MRIIISFLISVCCGFCNAQINLIPNPGFELYDTCPNIHPYGLGLLNWYNPSQGSPDYYHSCAGTSGSGVPHNFLGGGGYQYPKSGNSYVGLALYVDPAPNQCEYLQVELMDSLKKDSLYLIGFYVNMHNACMFSLKEFNIFFSDTAFFYNSVNRMPVAPSLRNIMSVFVLDTLNWTKVSSYYVASGGEKYITVGTFVDDSILNLNSSGFGIVPYAYYYYDDFYLGRVTDTTGLNEIETKISFDIYPNPANETIIVESNSPPGNLYVTDVMGKQLLQLNCTSNKSYFNIAHLPNGIYFIRKDSFCRKLIIQR